MLTPALISPSKSFQLVSTCCRIHVLVVVEFCISVSPFASFSFHVTVNAFVTIVSIERTCIQIILRVCGKIKNRNVTYYRHCIAQNRCLPKALGANKHDWSVRIYASVISPRRTFGILTTLAFWLRSSVVSVLNSLTTIMRAPPSLLVI